MTKQYISDLKENNVVKSCFLVREKALLKGKTGRQYVSMKLADKTGEIDSRIWDNVEQISSKFQSGDIIWAEGNIQVFQNRRQMIVRKVEIPDPSLIDMSEYVRSSSQNADEMFSELMEVVNSLDNPFVRKLMIDTLEDPEVKPKFLKSPAAKTIHHAWMGGLLEHILSITKIMEFMASHYNQLDRNLLIFGAVFHDIGKIWELSIDEGITYTDEGKLLGHIPMAFEYIGRAADKIPDFPVLLKQKLQHIVLSHHNRLDYGSPKRPKFLEAFVVAMIDDLDSKMSTISSFIEAERGGGQRWTSFSPHFERYFLIDEPENSSSQS